MNNEMKLSVYIDKLNAEQTPAEHKHPSNSSELNKLYTTVRLVRSLREPALPDDSFPDRLSCNIKNHLKNKSRNSKLRTCFTCAAAVASVLILALLLNYITPFNKSSIVYAMQKAFQDVKAYHGILKVTETNAEGTSTVQTELEVWADKKGRYYVKELEGREKGLITANNGQKKWQIQPDQKQVDIFPSFPDSYRFTFELGKEIQNVENALSTEVVGNGSVAGRAATVLKVTPKGGIPYQIWIDKTTHLPLQKRSGMQNALQYTITYTKIDYCNSIPSELTALSVPDGYKEINSNPELIVNNTGEARDIVGFMPNVPQNIPKGYKQDSIAIVNDKKLVKINYSSNEKGTDIIILQGKVTESFKPASTSVIEKINNVPAEIQSPIQNNSGILSGGLYEGLTNLTSIRWQQDGFEYAVIGNVPIDDIKSFVERIAKGSVEIPEHDVQTINKPQINVPVDLKALENEQKSVDAGHSPWELDPVFVSQVFVSLKISPQGITGNYPINYEDLKVIQNTGKDAIIEVNAKNSPIKRVYLKKLIRQDSTGFWSVVGYDPVSNK